jgi:hypothetical protein
VNGILEVKASALGRAALNTGLLLVALIAWAFAGTERVDPATAILLFLVAAAALLVVMHRRPWAALIVIGFLALPMSPRTLEVLDGWGAVFLAGTSLGTVMSLRHWPGGRWIAGSFPFWAMSGAVRWAEFVAVGMVFLGLVIVAVAPTLSGRRWRGEGEPQAHLASGALTPVQSRVYAGAHPNRVIRFATLTFTLLSVILALVAAAGFYPDITIGFALSSAILAATFAFSNWFSGRLRLRIDGQGLHSRLFYREHTIQWTEVASLSLRYVFLPGMGVRLVYYCVRSPTREFAFPSSMRDAAELRATIESATGLAWPQPEIIPTF